MVVKAADLTRPGIWRVNVGGIEIGAAIQPRELATEHRNLRVKCNDGLIATYVHYVIHGFTPFSSSHLRIEANAPLSVSGEGCGR